VWQPWKLKLAEDAKPMWKKFQREVEALMKEGAKLEYLRDWASKLPGAAARIAGVFHCVTSNPAEKVTIERKTMQQAIALATLLIDHALAVFDLMGRDRKVADASKILRWIRREGHKTFTVRDCHRAHQSRFREAGEVRPGLELLIEHGYLRRLPKPDRIGRASESFEVNPRAAEEPTTGDIHPEGADGYDKSDRTQPEGSEPQTFVTSVISKASPAPEETNEPAPTESANTYDKSDKKGDGGTFVTSVISEASLPDAGAPREGAGRSVTAPPEEALTDMTKVTEQDPLSLLDAEDDGWTTEEI
jgi:hypothetical protein